MTAQGIACSREEASARAKVASNHQIATQWFARYLLQEKIEVTVSAGT